MGSVVKQHEAGAGRAVPGPADHADILRAASGGVEEFAAAVGRFLHEHRAEFAVTPASAGPDYLQMEVERSRRLQQVLFDAGWSRVGWPAEVGGLGGSPLLRTALAEALVESGLTTGVSKTAMAFVEILGPAFLKSADRKLIDSCFGPFLSGREGWSQGFSEPEAGSDLSAMRTTATKAEGGWLLSGGKIWNTYGQFATRCVVLARTGSKESRHRGISAFLVDMDSPGLEVRPIDSMGDQPDFCQLNFADVHVPDDRLIGAEGKGWTVTMDILAGERGAVMWQESALLVRHLDELVAGGAGTRVGSERLGDVYLKIYGLRARSRRTQDALASGTRLGPLSSFDKILSTAAHQSLMDLARDADPEGLALGDAGTDQVLREDYYYSRAASIYGGTSEIQRNGIADRLLALPTVR